MMRYTFTTGMAKISSNPNPKGRGWETKLVFYGAESMVVHF